MTLAAAAAIAGIAGGVASVGSAVGALMNKPKEPKVEPVSAPSLKEPEPVDKSKAGRLALLATSPQGILSPPDTTRGRLFS